MRSPRFREESVTSTWIRATSPRTNCSTSYSVPKDASAAAVAAAAARSSARALEAGGAESDAEWPAYTTCQAGRPDRAIMTPSPRLGRSLVS